MLFLRLSPPAPSAPGRVWNGWMSRLADGPLYAALPLLMLLLHVPRATEFTCLMALGFAFELPAYKWIKHTCKRPRPCHADLDRANLLPVPDQYSFPSGHTAGAFVFAGAVTRMFPAFALPVWVFACCVGYSRVYNRLHFPADIFAGALLGSLCFLSASFLLQGFFP